MSVKILGFFLIPMVVSCSQIPPLSTDQPHSVRELRFKYTVPQQNDFTCGAASLATILTFYLNRPTTELNILNILGLRYDKEEMVEKVKSGFSFEDLIFVARKLGFSAQGAEISVTELDRLAGPVIVQLHKAKLEHFVVLRNVGNGVFYISDPAIGQKTMSNNDFQEEFSGYALAVWTEGSKLPSISEFQIPLDGVSVNNTLDRIIHGPIIQSHPTL